jgi:hypothetical protein
MYLIVLDDKEAYKRFHFFDKDLKHHPYTTKECFFETFSEANTMFVKLKKQDVNLFVKSRVISTKEIMRWLTINEIDAAISQFIWEKDKNEKH